jgi:hypothetical protein
MTLLFASQPAAIPVPGVMKHYTASDRSISIDHPSNWKPHLHSSHAIETEIDFRPARNVFMDINVNLAGSLMADVLKSMDTQSSAIADMVPGGEKVRPPELSPIVHFHAAQSAHLKNLVTEFPGFEDGETTKMQIRAREALATSCRWTSPGLFGSRPMVGRRVTMLSGDHQVSIVYGCPKEMEKAVMPAFDRMLKSLETDVAGGAQ